MRNDWKTWIVSFHVYRIYKTYNITVELKTFKQIFLPSYSHFSKEFFLYYMKKKINWIRWITLVDKVSEPVLRMYLLYLLSLRFKIFRSIDSSDIFIARLRGELLDALAPSLPSPLYPFLAMEDPFSCWTVSFHTLPAHVFHEFRSTMEK